MGKSWGKEIWEEKAKFQSGLGVSGGTTSILIGKKKYLDSKKHAQEIILKFLNSRKKEIENVLEIGPGPDALNTKFFLKNGYNLDLLDVSRTVLEKVKDKIGKNQVNFFEKDITDFNLKRKYDLVFCIGTFLHIPFYLALIVMNNLNKHITKGKYLIIDFPIKREMTLRRALWQGIYFLGHNLKKKFSKGFSVTCEEYTIEEINDILRRTGFKVINKKKSLWFLKKTN